MTEQVEEKFGDNNGVSIQYLVVNPKAGNIPLIFIPGAIVGAENIYAAIHEHLDFYCIIISIRGRGKSGKPVNGYTIEDQVSDIEAVVNAEKINELYIVGHSNGAGLAAAYAIKNSDKIKGLIMADYPPAYPAYPVEWSNRIRENMKGIDENFLVGIVRDAVRTNFTDELSKMKFKKLLLKGGGENSLLKPEKADELCTEIPDIQLVVIENCGHEIFNERPQEALEIIKKYMGS